MNFNDQIDDAVLEHVLNHTNIEVDSKEYRKLILELRQRVRAAVERDIEDWHQGKLLNKRTR